MRVSPGRFAALGALQRQKLASAGFTEAVLTGDTFGYTLPNPLARASDDGPRGPRLSHSECASCRKRGPRERALLRRSGRAEAEEQLQQWRQFVKISLVRDEEMLRYMIEHDVVRCHAAPPEIGAEMVRLQCTWSILQQLSENVAIFPFQLPKNVADISKRTRS